jgi:protein phosphatase
MTTSDGSSPSLLAAGLSDPGRRRQDNEDAFHVSEAEGLLLVSDGIGGGQAGTLASQAVARVVPLQVGALLAGRPSPAPADAARLLAQAILGAHSLLVGRTRDLPGVRGLGATVAACLLASDSVAIAHLGDSRIYLLRRRFLERLTRDHTVATALLGAGRITRRQFRRHPARNVLTRHVGLEGCPEPETGVLDVQPGDRLLLCTDGLTGMLPEREIGEILRGVPDRTAACRRLVDRANDAGGRDNVTVIVADVNSPPAPGVRGRNTVVVRRRTGRSLRQDETSEEVRLG